MVEQGPGEVEQGPGEEEQGPGEVEQGRDVTIEGGRWSTNTARPVQE